MDPLGLAIVNGLFTLIQFGGIERPAIINRLQGVPIEKYPDILDAMYQESKAARDQAIKDAP
jgi:hypothetical protein